MSHVRSRADVFFLFPQFYFLRDGLASAAGQHTKKINCVRFIRGGRWRLENIHLSTCWTLLRELDGRREFCFRSHASDTRVTCLTPSLAVSYFKHIHNEEEKKGRPIVCPPDAGFFRSCVPAKKPGQSLLSHLNSCFQLRN